ncbi:MAG: SLBB domain-containing protein [Dehalococcoidia bacterium]
MASWFDRNLRLMLVALAALLAAVIVYLAVQQRNEPPALEIDFGEATAGAPIQVYITGAVAEPGVYEIDDGARVVDLLNEAGGQAPDADLEAINLATRLHDEDQVVVPRQGQAASPPGATSQVAGTTAPVNINAATQGELMALDGIGEAYSQRIIDSRAADGAFASTEELVSRRILPRATYERIREQLTVGP